MYRSLPSFGGDERAVAEVVRGIMDGKTNNTGTFTLATGGAIASVMRDRRIGSSSVILFTPASSAAYADSTPYGAFQSVVDQTLTAANTAYAITLDTTDYSNGISLSNSSRVNVKNAGVYNFQWSGQFQNTDTQEHDVSVWLRKNGTDVVGSAGLISVTNSHGGIEGHTIIGWNYFIQLAANDYIELWWSAPSTQVSLQFYAAGTTPTRPTTASVIATMNLVSTTGTSGSGGLYVTAQGKGVAVVNHYANSTANKTYRYAIIG
jgi:hypothetical protein